MPFLDVSPLPPRRSHVAPRRRIRWPRLAAVIAAAALIVGAPIAILRAHMAGPMAAGVLGSALTLFAHQPNHPSVAVVRPQDPVTVLVMGTEKTKAFGGTQTDSMMVLSYDPVHKRASILSVPRDIWVDIPGYGYQRINSAYEFGGYKTAELTVEKYIGVPIEYYAVIDYNTLVKLVNDVGGINVDVPYAINDTCYPNPQENRCTVFRLSAGPHHLDGTTALKFARERHSLPLADISREADQQRVLLALKRALLKPRNLLHLPTIIGDMTQLVTTNLPYDVLPRLAEEALHLPRTSIQHAVLNYKNHAVTAFTTKGGADVLQLHPNATRAVVTHLFGTVLAHMNEATIQVENGAPTQQPLATDFSRVLDGMGATTLQPEPAARTDYAHNHVYWINAALAGAPPTLAYMLAEMLDARLVKRAVPSSQAQIVLILGKAFPKTVP